MRFQAARARAYYAEARPLLGMIEPSCRSSLWALIEIYSRLLERIERSGFDVLSRRISLPGWQKTWIVLRGSLSGGML
jgi:phytoene synthase